MAALPESSAPSQRALSDHCLGRTPPFFCLDDASMILPVKGATDHEATRHHIARRAARAARRFHGPASPARFLARPIGVRHLVAEVDVIRPNVLANARASSRLARSGAGDLFHRTPALPVRLPTADRRRPPHTSTPCPWHVGMHFSDLPGAEASRVPKKGVRHAARMACQALRVERQPTMLHALDPPLRLGVAVANLMHAKTQAARADGLVEGRSHSPANCSGLLARWRQSSRQRYGHRRAIAFGQPKISGRRGQQGGSKPKRYPPHLRTQHSS